MLDKSGSYNIAFNDVSFGYEKGKDALSNVFISLKLETLTAFVGSSGAGKTTAARFIVRQLHAVGRRDYKRNCYFLSYWVIMIS
ncbi:hypothetical protein V6615_01230 [Oscillospiraceae bacterium PP1C4]